MADLSNKITVRKAVETDAKSIIEFNIAMAWETEKKKLQPELISAGVHSLFQQPELGFYMIAETDGIAAGSLMITKEWSDWRNGIFWWIQSVYVLPEFRRKGVYRYMYRHIKEMARNDTKICGFRLYVEKDNQIAQQTYKKLGMEESVYKMYEEMIGKI